MAGGGIGAAASIGSSLIGAVGSSRAAAAQTAAANKQAKVQKYIFDESTKLTQPWRDTGENALNALAYEFGVGPHPNLGAANDVPNEDGGGSEGASSGRLMVSSPTGYMSTRIKEAFSPGFEALGDRLFGGARQYGGPVEMGKTYLTGEDGAEAFRPEGTNALIPIAQNGPEMTTFNTPGEVIPNAYTQAEGMNGVRTPYEKGQFNPEGDAYTGYMATPGYNFRFNEGVRAIDSSAASRGNLFSGSTLKALTRYGQDVGTQDYSRHLQGLNALAGMGIGGVNQQLGAGQNYAQGMSNAYANMGNAQAAGAMGVANSLQNGIGNWLGWQAFQGAA